MRIALVTPAPPVASGIVDAVEELLPYLERRFEVELYLDDPSLRARVWPGRHHLSLRRELRLDGRLLPVYQLGNHESCRFLLPLAYRHPGLLVLHDLGLHHLLAQFFLEGLLEQEYLDELRFSHGEDGATAARIINSGFYSDALYQRFPLFKGIAARSRAVLVHSQHAARALRAACPDTPVFVSPLHSGLSHLDVKPLSRLEARERLGIAAGAFVVGTVGNLIASRRLESCLEAFRRHRERHPDAVYLLAGEEKFELVPLLERWNLQGSVIRLGRVPLVEFHAAISACDLLCNLRYPTLGETSGSLIRILGMGRPVLVSNLEPFLEFPASFCPRVDVDDREVEQLEARLGWFQDHAAERDELGRVAARYVAERHQASSAAEVYEAAIHAALSHDEPSRAALGWCDPLPRFHRAVARRVKGPIPDLGPVFQGLLEAKNRAYASD